MVLKIQTWICALLIAIGYDGLNAQVIPFDNIVVFGDSNSDTGNIYRLTGNTRPPSPYYQGRFSNGPVWIDRFTLQTVSNYAYGGATTDNTFIKDSSPMGSQIPGVRQQVTLYLNQFNSSQVNLNRTVYIIWAAANDFAINTTAAPASVATSLEQSIVTLLQAQVKHIVVVNLPQLSVFPMTNTLGLDAVLNFITSQYNSNLMGKINALRIAYPRAVLRVFNLNSIVSNIVANQSSVKFQDTKRACWISTDSGISVNCTNADNNVFIDSTHFTTKVHDLLATEMRKFLASGTSPNSFTGYSTVLLGFVALMHYIFI